MATDKKMTPAARGKEGSCEAGKMRKREKMRSWERGKMRRQKTDDR